MSEVISFDTSNCDTLNPQLLDMAINDLNCRDTVLNSMQLLSHMQFYCRNFVLPQSVILITAMQTMLIKWSNDSFDLTVNVYGCNSAPNAYFIYDFGAINNIASFSTGNMPPDQIIRAFS